MDLRNLGERLEGNDKLDGLVDAVHGAATALLPRGSAKDALHGVWLGHPLHPLLTDLPIGFWTAASILDIAGGKKTAAAADALVGLGLTAAVPTVAAGVADWTELERPEQRSGVVHAVANAVATCLYAASYLARRRGRRGAGVGLAIAGAGAATIGGFLGGHLSYRRAAGVNHAASAAAADEWAAVAGEAPRHDGQASAGTVDGTTIAVFSVEGELHGLADRCSHLGGPLHEGEVVDGCIRCPWHGSEFRIVDGRVRRGPATSTQPAYEIHDTATGLEARRKPMP